MSTEDIQSDVPDLERDVQAIASHLSSASSCESREDLAANLAEALAASRALSKEIARLLRKAEKEEADG